MEAVLRGVAVYGFLLFILRISGKRSLSQITSFDLVLLLIISEATQQAMIGDDSSLVNATLVMATLLLCNVGLSLLKGRSVLAARLLEGVPTLLVAHGQPLHDRLRRARVDEQDVLSAAREAQGLERREQIRFAVLEANGRITVVPEPDGRGGGGAGRAS